MLSFSRSFPHAGANSQLSNGTKTSLGRHKWSGAKSGNVSFLDGMPVFPLSGVISHPAKQQAATGVEGVSEVVFRMVKCWQQLWPRAFVVHLVSRY